MSTADLKSELKLLIDKESDPQILTAIKKILKKTNSEQKLKEKLVSRAEKAEKDIKEGNVYKREEV